MTADTAAEAADETAEPVRLRTPADIVDAVPHLIGFHPEDSFVFMALQGERRRLGIVGRADLPNVTSAKACARYITGVLERDEASQAIIVMYPPRGGREHPPVVALAEALRKRLESARVAVADMLCVFEGRWWSLQCDDASCCPPEGTAFDPNHASAAAAASAAHGRVTLASRRELERTIEPVGGLLGAAMQNALAQTEEWLANAWLRGEREQLGAETVALFRDAVRARLTPETASPLGVDEAARLIIGLDDVLVRDEIITWFEGEWGDAARAFMTELVRHAVPPFDATPLTVLGWIAYLQGEGALAGIAVDRVIESGNTNGMVPYLDQALRVPLNPSIFRDSMRKLRQTPLE